MRERFPMMPIGRRAPGSLDRHLRNGLNIHDGKITHPAVAEALNLPYSPAEDVAKAMVTTPAARLI
jgi:alanine dehydrogenase